MYSNFLAHISNEATKAFDAILANHNFDNGTEFEVALCKLLQLILPKKYSICRGYVVTADDQKAGDDVIIYNSDNFPKVRIIDDDFAIKQYIPIESVYAYIEAKHTLWIDGKNENLTKALQQVSDVKKLTREKRTLDTFPGGIRLSEGNNVSIKITAAKNWPEYRNPMFGCIISRYLKSSKQDNIDDKYFLECIKSIHHDMQYATDLVIGGENWIGLPTIGDEKNQTIDSPFHLPEQSQRVWFNKKNSFGVGICNIIRALNYIELTEINYSRLMAHELDVPLKEG
jgi:hypothetical protein